MSRTLGGVQPGTVSFVPCSHCEQVVGVPAGCILRCPGEEQRRRLGYCHAVVDPHTGVIVRKGDPL